MNMSFWISIFPLILLLIMLNLRMSLSTPLAQVNSEGKMLHDLLTVIHYIYINDP